MTVRESGHPSKRKDFLPADKQYLVTRRVPCRHRPKALEREAIEEGIEGEGDDAWVTTHNDRPQRSAAMGGMDTVPDIDMDDAAADEEMRDMDIDDIPGLEDMQMPSDDDSDDETTRKMYPTITTTTTSTDSLLFFL